MVLGESGYKVVDWSKLDWDRVQWLAFVNMINRRIE
jgi:hypothetical protein